VNDDDQIIIRDELAAEIEDLRAFERAYRARLIAYLENLLAQMRSDQMRREQ
jgi:cell division septum initiation protein DivIVA